MLQESDSDPFVMELLNFDTGKRIGYLGVDDSEWCRIRANIKDATILQKDTRTAGEMIIKSNENKERFLTQSKSGYVGFYREGRSHMWLLHPKTSELISKYSDTPLSYEGSGDGKYIYVYSGAGYSRLEVNFVAPPTEEIEA